MLLATAEADAWVPLDRVLETAEVLSRMNAHVDLRLRPGGDHLIAPAELAAARALLAGTEPRT